jgi:hypothetical protein
MSEPRGRKSRPTSASRTLDLPLLWLPTTATCGRSIVELLPSCAKMSCSLLTIGITDDPTAAAAAAAAVAAGDEVIEAGDAEEKWSSAMGASGRRRGATSFAATPRVLEKEEDGKEMSGRVSADRELFFDFGAGI